MNNIRKTTVETPKIAKPVVGTPQQGPSVEQVTADIQKALSNDGRFSQNDEKKLEASLKGASPEFKAQVGEAFKQALEDFAKQSGKQVDISAVALSKLSGLLGTDFTGLFFERQSAGTKAGEAGIKGLGGAIDNKVDGPVAGATKGLDLRSGSNVPAPALNAITPLLTQGHLSDSELTSGIAAIHNDWFKKAQGEGYLLGERNKADPVMKMARSFFVGVEAQGGELKLKLDDKESEFVRSYGRKQVPDKTLTDAEALGVGTQKILDEIMGNNLGALQESMKLVTAHLAGDIARLGSGDYLEKVKGMGDLKVPEKKTSLTSPNTEKALAIVEERIGQIDQFVAFLGDKGTSTVARGDVPKALQGMFDLFDEEHNRWVKQQVSWGATPNADFVRTEELPANRLALDGPPLRGAYETLAAGLKSGSISADALNAIVPLLEKGRLTADQLAQGLALIHNDWYSQAKGDGYLLGVRDKADPVMKMARSFFVQVDVKGSELSLVLTDKEKDFVRSYGRKQQPDAKLSDPQALSLGTETIVSEIKKNNQGALDDGLKLISGHLGGNVVRIGTANYLDDVKGMQAVEVPRQSKTAGVAPDKAREGVDKMLASVDEFVELLRKQGDEKVPRESVPPHLRQSWDLFAEEHDRWLAQQISWGSSPNQDWVHSSELSGKRMALDAAPIRGALLTFKAALA